MLQIMFLVSLKSSQRGGVHGLGSMTFGLVMQKFLNRKIFNSHLFWLDSHPARLNQVLDMPDVQVQEPLVVVKKCGRV
jgi:hypothetical protein